jgi:hypothetical protein
VCLSVYGLIGWKSWSERNAVLAHSAPLDDAVQDDVHILDGARGVLGERMDEVARAVR